VIKRPVGNANYWRAFCFHSKQKRTGREYSRIGSKLIRFDAPRHENLTPRQMSGAIGSLREIDMCIELKSVWENPAQESHLVRAAMRCRSI
jgi:hypothetical protein